MKRLLSKMLVGVLAVTAGVVLSAGDGVGRRVGDDLARRGAASGRGRERSTVGFTIRQHGVTPVNPDGEVGHRRPDRVRRGAVLPRDRRRADRVTTSRRSGSPTPGASTLAGPPRLVRAQDLGRIDVARPATAATVARGPQGARRSTYRGSLVLRVLLPVLGVGLGAFAVADALRRPAPAVPGPDHHVTRAGVLAGLAAACSWWRLRWPGAGRELRRARSRSARPTGRCCSGRRVARHATPARTPRGRARSRTCPTRASGPGGDGRGSTAAAYLRQSILEPVGLHARRRGRTGAARRRGCRSSRCPTRRPTPSWPTCSRR